MTGPTRSARSGSVAGAHRALGVEAPRADRPVAAASSVVSKAARPACCRACGVRGVGADLAQVAGHQAAGVLGHVRRTGHAHLHPALGERRPAAPTRRHTCWTGSRRPRRVRRPAGSTSARGSRQTAASGPSAPRLTAHRQPVRRHLVAGAQRAVQGGDDHQPPVRAAPGGGVERGEVEGVVQHPGVEVGGGDGGGGGQAGVAGDVGDEVGADAEPRRCVGGGADRRELAGHGGAPVGQLGEGEPGRVGRAPPRALGLGLRRRAAG